MTSRDPQKCHEAVRSAILATAWLLVDIRPRSASRVRKCHYRTGGVRVSSYEASTGSTGLFWFKLIQSFIRSNNWISHRDISYKEDMPLQRNHHIWLNTIQDITVSFLVLSKFHPISLYSCTKRDGLVFNCQYSVLPKWLTFNTIEQEAVVYSMPLHVRYVAIWLWTVRLYRTRMGWTLCIVRIFIHHTNDSK